MAAYIENSTIQNTHLWSPLYFGTSYENEVIVVSVVVLVNNQSFKNLKLELSIEHEEFKDWYGTLVNLGYILHFLSLNIWEVMLAGNQSYICTNGHLLNYNKCSMFISYQYQYKILRFPPAHRLIENYQIRKGRWIHLMLTT